MDEQTITVETSPQIEVESGPLITLTSDERMEFRRTGELPKQKEEPAASDTGKDLTADAGEAATPKVTQDHTEKKPTRKPDAEERIRQLTAENKRLIAEREEALKSKPEPKKEPEPKLEPQEPQYTRPKPTPEGKGPDGKPYATYEDYIEDLTDWKGEQREARNQREAAAKAQEKEFFTKVDEARSRYENFEEVVQPTAAAINTDAAIPIVVKTFLGESENLPDILFTLGSDPAELAKFTKMAKENPGKALRYIALTESLILEELDSKAKGNATPAKTQTAAPKPPAEVGGRAASPGDALESAAKANDFRSFKAEANRRALAKLKG